MLVEQLCNLFFSLSNTFLNFIPLLDFPSLAGATAGLGVVIAAVSPFMPVGALVLGFQVFLAINGFKLIMSVINFVIRKIPTID